MDRTPAAVRPAPPSPAPRAATPLPARPPAAARRSPAGVAPAARIPTRVEQLAARHLVPLGVASLACLLLDAVSFLLDVAAVYHPHDPATHMATLATLWSGSTRPSWPSDSLAHGLAWPHGRTPTRRQLVFSARLETVLESRVSTP